MKGIYKKPSSKYCVVTWGSQGKLSYHGTFKTKEEALDKRENVLKGHHWGGVTTDPSKYGFVYSIVDLDTEEIYFGRRVYNYYNAHTGNRDIPGLWEFYSSSSKVVQQRIEEGHRLRYTILANTESNDESSYLEQKIISMYVHKRLPSGKLMCMNGVIPKVFIRGLEEAKDNCKEDLRRIKRYLP